MFYNGGTMEETIDILLATYNGEKYIKEQIESILQQTYSNFRLIISDDASQDNTIEIIKQYQQKDDRIKLFQQEKNLGSNKNFEFLLQNVENSYFMLSDQDDIWKEDKIEKTYKYLQEQNSDLVFTDLELVDNNLQTINRSFMEYKRLSYKIKKYGTNFNTLYLNNYVTGCTILAKKDYIKNILPFPQNTVYLIHDYWIALIISVNGKISYLRESTILYRQHEKNQIGSKTKSDEMQSFEEIRELFIKVKLEHFNILNQNKEIFKTNQQMTDKGIKYYQHLKDIKYINFRNWILFYRLYKYEEFRYIILNFLILNFPIISKTLWKIRRWFK